MNTYKTDFADQAAEASVHCASHDHPVPIHPAERSRRGLRHGSRLVSRQTDFPAIARLSGNIHNMQSHAQHACMTRPPPNQRALCGRQCFLKSRRSPTNALTPIQGHAHVVLKRHPLRWSKMETRLPPLVLVGSVDAPALASNRMRPWLEQPELSLLPKAEAQHPRLEYQLLEASGSQQSRGGDPAGREH